MKNYDKRNTCLKKNVKNSPLLGSFEKTGLISQLPACFKDQYNFTTNALLKVVIKECLHNFGFVF